MVPSSSAAGRGSGVPSAPHAQVAPVSAWRTRASHPGAWSPTPIPARAAAPCLPLIRREVGAPWEPPDAVALVCPGFPLIQREVGPPRGVLGGFTHVHGPPPPRGVLGGLAYAHGPPEGDPGGARSHPWALQGGSWGGLLTPMGPPTRVDPGGVHSCPWTPPTEVDPGGARSRPRGCCGQRLWGVL